MSLATVRARVRLVGLLIGLPTSIWISAVPVSAQAIGPGAANDAPAPSSDPMDGISAAYNRGDYETAAALAEGAYAENPDPTFLFSAAEAFLAADDCERALRSFKRFLATEPPEIDADAARRRMQRCAEETPEEPSPPSPSAVTPPTTPPPIQPQPTIARDPIFLGTLIGGIGVAGAGAGLLVGSQLAATDAPFAPTEDAWEAKVAQARGLGTAGAVLLGLGGALIVGAVARAIVLRRR